jgi:hypothetical protein
MVAMVAMDGGRWRYHSKVCTGALSQELAFKQDDGWELPFCGHELQGEKILP